MSDRKTGLLPRDDAAGDICRLLQAETVQEISSHGTAAAGTTDDMDGTVLCKTWRFGFKTIKRYIQRAGDAFRANFLSRAHVKQYMAFSTETFIRFGDGYALGAE